MSRDGEGSKDIRQRKRPVERRRAALDQRLMPKRRHPAVYTGMAFAILGGLMVASTFLVSWVDNFGPDQVLVGQLFVWNLEGHPEWAVISYLAILAPIVGAMCALLSGLALASERKDKVRKLAAMGVLVTSVLAAVIIIALIWLLKEQYIAAQAERSIYGPAIFLSVFGTVLAVAGGIVLSVDYYQSEKKRGSFVTAPGSRHLKTVLRPAKKGRARQDTEFEAKEIREEMLSEAARSDAPEDEEEAPCPSCKSPVKSSWERCPVCGEELG